MLYCTSYKHTSVSKGLIPYIGRYLRIITKLLTLLLYQSFLTY